MARAGRPREPGARRRKTTRAARLPARDEGTPEARRHKRALVGGADAALGENAIGVLQAHGVATASQADAAHEFAILRWRFYGKPFGRSWSYGEMPGGHDEPAHQEARRMAYFRAFERALANAGSDAHEAVFRLAVLDELPLWWRRFRGCRMDGLDRAAQAALGRGLAALKSFKSGSPRTRVARPGAERLL